MKHAMFCGPSISLTTWTTYLSCSLRYRQHISALQYSMELSKRTADKTDSNIYKDLGTVPPLTPRRTATSPTIRIKVKETPIQTISDAKPRKAPVPPVPPVPTLPLMTMSLKSSISQRRLRTADGEEREQKETFSFVQVPVDSVRPTPNDEILILRTKIDQLESTVEELQHIVKVSKLSTRGWYRHCNGIAIHNDKQLWRIGQLKRWSQSTINSSLNQNPPSQN